MPDLSEKPIHPGEVLAEVYMKPVEPPVTVGHLAESIGVSPEELANFIAGKRPVAMPLAARLAMRFKTTTRYWLRLQDLYDKRSHTSAFLQVHRRRKR